MTKKEKQKLFNKAVKGLASQGFKQSITPGGVCLYRGPERRCCAVGWLIPDSKYNAEMEGLPVDDIGYFHGSQVLTFLSQLQEAHDDADGSNDMKGRLRSFALVRGLKLPKVLQ